MATSNDISCYSRSRARLLAPVADSLVTQRCSLVANSLVPQRCSLVANSLVAQRCSLGADSLVTQRCSLVADSTDARFGELAGGPVLRMVSGRVLIFDF